MLFSSLFIFYILQQKNVCLIFDRLMKPPNEYTNSGEFIFI